MSQYIVEVSGTNSLEQVERAISGEEVTGAEFVKSSISFHDGSITNLVTFNDLPAGKRPTGQPVLIKQGTQMPAGRNAIWAGVMLIAGANVVVTVVR